MKPIMLCIPLLVAATSAYADPSALGSLPPNVHTIVDESAKADEMTDSAYMSLCMMIAAYLASGQDKVRAFCKRHLINRRFWAATLILIAAPLIYHFYALNLWLAIRVPTLHTVEHVVNLFRCCATFTMLPEGGLFSFWGWYMIGWPCSGLEGVTAMVMAISATAMVYRDHRFNLPLTYLKGIAVMWVVNVLRISAVMLLGEGHPRQTATMFHTHWTWLIYAGFIIWLLSRMEKATITAKE